MSEVLTRHVPGHIVTADFAGRADHLLTARQMLEHLGKMAISSAIDRQAQASSSGDKAAIRFWGRVCDELVDMAIAADTAWN